MSYFYSNRNKKNCVTILGFGRCICQRRPVKTAKRVTRNPMSQTYDDIQQSLFNDMYVSTFVFVFGCDTAHVLVRMRSCLSLARSDTSRHGVLRMSRSLRRCSFICRLVARCIAIIRSVARICRRLRCVANRSSTLNAFSRVNCSFLPLNRWISSVNTRELCDVTDDEYDMLSVT